MTDVVLGAAVLSLTVVLLVAGAGKLARPPDPVHMDVLGLPRGLQRYGFVRTHAVAEIVLALALLGAPGPWLAGVGTVVLLLTVAYLVVALRAWRSPEPLACHCFGQDDDRPVGPLHVALNALLVLAAGGAVAAGATGWWAVDDLHPAILGAAGAIALVVHLWGSGEEGSGRVQPYLRRPIPAGQVVVDGVRRDLTELAAQRAQLLVRIPRLGKDAEHLRTALPDWRRRLPHVDVRVTQGDAGGAYRRLGLTGAPSAVVLGSDGLLAGGPVVGADLVRDLVDELARTAPARGHTGPAERPRT
ncbi:MauE/DoxX family redox-associated membrane protein [Georgenia sp. Z1491]|uniref:MauE/DoxX family redox-associated membrane protein n=1 Tax=Georgenia sp. Z1491 TaxID=3416707 RepID=UPI003CF128B2